MRTSKKWQMLASAVLAASGGCSLVLGIQDVTQRDGGSTGGVGGTGGAQSSSSGTMSSSTSSGSSSGSTSSSTGGPVCDQATRWATMSASAIAPPWHWANLDERGADDGGITLTEAVAVNCEGVDAGGQFPNGGGTFWGDAGQVYFAYDLTSGRHEYTSIGPGYTGNVTWHGTDTDGGVHTYVAQVGAQITKDGHPFVIDWKPSADAGTTQATLDAELTELYNGLVSTFAPGTPTSTNCRTDTSCAPRKCCLQSPDDGTQLHGAVFGVRPLRFYLTFQHTDLPQPTPSTPNGFYTFAAFSWNDDQKESLWSSFDTTQVNAASKGFAGAEFDGRYLYLVPNAAGALLTRFDTTQPNAFATPGPAWTTYDTTLVNANAKQFSGGSFDGVYVYFSPATNGVVTRVNSTTAFALGSSWSAFDTATLTPPAKQFASAIFNGNSGYMVFPPSTGSVVAAYNTYAGDMTDPSSWVTYDLAAVSPKLTGLHSGVAAGQYVYLAPHGTSPYPGIAAQWNAYGNLNDPTTWATFDLSKVDPNLPGLLVFDGAVYDQKQYVYFVPASSGTSNGGDVLRFDTLNAAGFTSTSSWTYFSIGTPVFTTGGFDGRFLYFSGGNTTVTRYDGFASFSNSMSWSYFDTYNVNHNAAAYYGSAFDGRYMYFVPDTFSTLVRFDAYFPPTGVNVFASSFY